MFSRKRRRSAFTFIDLVVAAVMTALVIAVAVPAISRTQQVANNANCKSNLRQIAIAFNNYDMQVGYLPRPAGTNMATQNSILWQIGPYMEIDVVTGAVVASTDLKVYECPA